MRHGAPFPGSDDKIESLAICTTSSHLKFKCKGNVNFSNTRFDIRQHRSKGQRRKSGNRAELFNFSEVFTDTDLIEIGAKFNQINSAQLFRHPPKSADSRMSRLETNPVKAILVRQS